MSLANQAYATSAAGCAPPTLSPVQSSLGSLQNEQSITHDIITDLEHRLESALRARDEAKPGPQLIRSKESDLQGQINERLEHAEGINNRLRSIVERLTL